MYCFECYWRDRGTSDHIAQAAQDLRQGMFSLRSAVPRDSRAICAMRFSVVQKLFPRLHVGVETSLSSCFETAGCIYSCLEPGDMV